MKPLFLLPPSEGKMTGGDDTQTISPLPYTLPLDIARHATEKDLKCTGTRYQEGIELNTHIATAPVLPAIERYTGVMFKAIDYASLSGIAQAYFDTHIYIISGMYGLIRPTDLIANYKLPIDSKGLRKYRKAPITDTLMGLTQYDTIINLLPQAHQKVIDRSLLPQQIIHIDFMTKKDDQLKKYTHGVKKVKGVWIRTCCEEQSLPFAIDVGEKEQRKEIIA